MTDSDERTRELAAESRATGEATGWFERLYAAAEAGEATVPWDRATPHVLLGQWTREHGVDGAGRRAIVVGCGFGTDAEHVAGLGFDTIAFDIAPTAVAAARRRAPGSRVAYVEADLLNAPAQWRHAFDLVVESLTVQSLPPPLHAPAIEAVTQLVAPGGTLLVISTARDERDGPVDGPPWPLTRGEVESFATSGLEPVSVEHIADASDPAIGRWRATFRRP
jgi:SAM-dependent methyltransferase